MSWLSDTVASIGNFFEDQWQNTKNIWRAVTAPDASASPPPTTEAPPETPLPAGSEAATLPPNPTTPAPTNVKRPTPTPATVGVTYVNAGQPLTVTANTSVGSRFGFSAGFDHSGGGIYPTLVAADVLRNMPRRPPPQWLGKVHDFLFNPFGLMHGPHGLDTSRDGRGGPRLSPEAADYVQRQHIAIAANNTLELDVTLPVNTPSRNFTVPVDKTHSLYITRTKDMRNNGRNLGKADAYTVTLKDSAHPNASQTMAGSQTMVRDVLGKYIGQGKTSEMAAKIQEAFKHPAGGASIIDTPPRSSPTPPPGAKTKHGSASIENGNHYGTFASANPSSPTPMPRATSSPRGSLRTAAPLEEKIETGTPLVKTERTNTKSRLLDPSRPRTV